MQKVLITVILLIQLLVMLLTSLLKIILLYYYTVYLIGISADNLVERTANLVVQKTVQREYS